MLAVSISSKVGPNISPFYEAATSDSGLLEAARPLEARMTNDPIFNPTVGSRTCMGARPRLRARPMSLRPRGRLA